MSERDISRRVWQLFQREEWSKAIALLEKERKRAPNDHWILTQLGVAFYEQRKYKDAMAFFLASKEIMEDCPLTLWNYAGALDALGESNKANEVYVALLKSRQTPEQHSCWESKEWTDSLKTDCVYRIGVCFEKLGRNAKAENCFRQYLDLISHGIQATYPANDVIEDLNRLASRSRRDHSARQRALTFTAKMIDKPRESRASSPKKKSGSSVTARR